ncbi:hypothetical protein GH140_04540 [bacterium]|nr:hypothetical protein [bacterium]
MLNYKGGKKDKKRPESNETETGKRGFNSDQGYKGRCDGPLYACLALCPRRNTPTPFAVFAVIYNGQILADHQISRKRFKNIMNKILK